MNQPKEFMQSFYINLSLLGIVKWGLPMQVLTRLWYVKPVPNTTSIPRLKAYIFFRKSNYVKFDQAFRRIYQQIWYFGDTTWKYISL
jgi:hypothetical protein